MRVSKFLSFWQQEVETESKAGDHDDEDDGANDGAEDDNTAIVEDVVSLVSCHNSDADCIMGSWLSQGHCCETKTINNSNFNSNSSWESSS